MTSIAGGFAAPAGRTGHELLVLRSLEQVSKNFEGSKTVACLKHTPPQHEFESSSAYVFDGSSEVCGPEDRPRVLESQDREYGEFRISNCELRNSPAGRALASDTNLWIHIDKF